MRREIPVVFATDENYLFYTCVAITSLAESAQKGTFYQVYILVAEEFKDKNGLIDKVNACYDNIYVEFLRIDAKVFEDVIINNGHVTKATFYRLILSELIKEEKCIYLDADIIVTEDLAELFNIDITDYYIAGCRDIWIDLLWDDEREDRRKRTQIPDMSQYVNAGVLLFHLEKIRKDGMKEKFLEGMKRDYPYEDQDIINVCCYDKICFLPAKWNLFTLFMGQIQEMYKKNVPADTIQAFQARNGIIHYATPFIRPWERNSCWANKEWWQVASKWKEEPIYQELEARVLKREYENSWQFYLDKIAEHEKIVIFGFTEYGKKVCNWLLANHIHKPIVFVDNNTEKQGQKYKEIPVISLEESIGLKGEVLYIISSQQRKQEVEKLLLDVEIKQNSIISYVKQKKDDYIYLDDRYYPRELNDICMREMGMHFEEMGYTYEEMVLLLKADSSYQEWIEWYWMKWWLLR
uniref:glycosyltransferase family 8 protein n=1 Tax=Acetatifactor sp. TaxID=1872090 RepID=UPI004055A47B